MKENIPDLNKFRLGETSFNKLMQKRIRKVLIVCSNYDAFILEQDGRIEEQVFNEYVSLNLSNPPTFRHASNKQDVFKILQREKIDLIIEMFSLSDLDPFEMAKQIKFTYPNTPIVVLTHFTREVSLKLANEDLSNIDHIFCWLGNPDLLVAIIKLLEDKMNAEYDMIDIGVQAIILVEDSIRFASSYLPLLYKVILEQARFFMSEGLNEHQKLMRMRGRPKILFAHTYDEAIAYYEKYKHNILGVISDVSYKVNATERDTYAKAGLKLCRKIKDDDWYMPVLLQSSDKKNLQYAKELQSGFIHKYSKNLNNELKEHILKYFPFGYLVFRDPKTGQEIDRVSNLQELQSKMLSLPDEVFEYHASRNDFSKWLNARALFSLGNSFKDIDSRDFKNMASAKEYLHKAISYYRTYRSRGVIAQFERTRFDESFLFSRIGNGSIGGKARGLAFLNTLINKYKLEHKYNNLHISIPRTVVLSTEVFDQFMVENDLYEFGLCHNDDKEIFDKFIACDLPSGLRQDLITILRQSSKPLAIRSSSKLEDSYYQPFAGIYTTHMLPAKGPFELLLYALECSIKSIFASVYYQSSKAYISATSNAIDEEQMGIIIQEVCGRQYGEYYFPALSGVGRSVNFYPISPEKNEDGIVNLAMGLGKYIVEGGLSLRFCPKFPEKVIQLSNAGEALKSTQKNIQALTSMLNQYSPSPGDEGLIQNVRLKNLSELEIVKMLSSAYAMANDILVDGPYAEGQRVLTFSSVLQHRRIPLAKSLNEMLKIGQKEMNNPVELEFACDLEDDLSHGDLTMLQIRPVVSHEQKNVQQININKNDKSALVYSSKALGNGQTANLKHILYIEDTFFNAENNRKIASLIGEINHDMGKKGDNYVLIGPGRWGSSDPWLGIDVKWNQILHSRVIVEYAMKGRPIDPSQGTHFFHNLTSFEIAYLTVDEFSGDGYINHEYMRTAEGTMYDMVKIISLPESVQAIVNGRTNEGIIFFKNQENL